MLIARRSLPVLAAGLGLAPVLGGVPVARADDSPTADRAIGRPEAKVTVNEYFSLTCSHCAAFAVETFPRIRSELIDTGRIRWIFNDYPLDQVALVAAQVGRYLPVDRYEPYINALFATQNRWAFARDANHTEEIWKTAGLAGLSRAAFDKAVADTALRDWILQQQQVAHDKWKIDSTPSFVINGTKFTGEMSFDAFRKLIPDS